MNIPAQVAHIVWKDLRAQRLFIAGFVGMILISTVRSLVRISGVVPGDADLWSTNDLLASLFVLLFGVLIVIALIRLDSPLDARDQWTAVPINPKAVWGGKIATALLIFVLVLGVGQFAVVRALGARMDDAVIFVTMSLLAVASSLATAALLAAVMPTVQRCLVAWMLLGLFGIVVATSPLGTGGSRPAGTLWQLFIGTTVVVSKIALLLLLFTKRWDENRSRWFVVGAVMVLTVGHSTTLSIVKALAEPDRPRRVVAPPKPAMITRDSQTLTVTFAFHRPNAGQRVMLVNPELELRMADGTVLTPLGAFSSGSLRLNNSRPRVEVPFYTRDNPYMYNVDIRGDSIFVGLRYPMGESLGEKRRLPISVAEFSAFLELQEGVVVQDLKVDGPTAQTRGIAAAVARSSNDEKSLFEIETRALGSAGRSALEFVDLTSPASGSVTFELEQDYPMGPTTVTYLLTGRNESDTLTLFSTGVRPRETHLPIPFTHVYHSSIGLAPLNGRLDFDGAHWSGARIVVRRWRYAGHTSLHSSMPVQ